MFDKHEKVHQTWKEKQTETKIDKTDEGEKIDAKVEKTDEKTDKVEDK